MTLSIGLSQPRSRSFCLNMAGSENSFDPRAVSVEGDCPPRTSHPTNIFYLIYLSNLRRFWATSVLRKETNRELEKSAIVKGNYIDLNYKKPTLFSDRQLPTRSNLRIGWRNGHLESQKGKGSLAYSFLAPRAEPTGNNSSCR